MIYFSVSVQGFTFTNRPLGMNYLSHPEGSPQRLGYLGMLAPKVFVYWDHRGGGPTHFI